MQHTEIKLSQLHNTNEIIGTADLSITSSLVACSHMGLTVESIMTLKSQVISIDATIWSILVKSLCDDNGSNKEILYRLFKQLDLEISCIKEISDKMLKSGDK